MPNPSQMVTLYEGGVASSAYLSDDKVDEKADSTYLYLRVVGCKTSGANANSHAAANVQSKPYKNRFGVVFLVVSLITSDASFQLSIFDHRRQDEMKIIFRIKLAR